MTIPWTHLTGVPHLHIPGVASWLHQLLSDVTAGAIVALLAFTCFCMVWALARRPGR